MVKKQLTLFSQLLWYNFECSSCGLVSPSLLCWFFLFLLLDCWVSPCPTSLDEIGHIQGGMAVDCPTSLATPSPCVILPVVFQSLGHVLLFATPWTAACQASLSCTIYQSLLKLMFIESLVPSNHLILCCPLLLLSLSQHQVLFQWVGSSHQVAKILELQLQYQSCQWIFRVDFH